MKKVLSLLFLGLSLMASVSHADLRANYFDNPPTLNNGDQGVLSLDNRCNLKVVAGKNVTVEGTVAVSGINSNVTVEGVVAATSTSGNYFSPQDGTVAYTSPTTVTCSGFPFTVSDANCRVISIRVKPLATGVWSMAYVSGQKGISLTATSDVITITGATTPFATGDAYAVIINGPARNEDKAGNNLRIGEVAPLNLQVLEESWQDTTNVATGDAYYPSSTGSAMMGYKDFSVTGKLIEATGAITLEVHGTNDEDTTNADWIKLYGLDAQNNTTINSITCTAETKTIAWDFSNFNFRHVRLKSSTSDNSNTVIYKVRRKAL